MLYLIVFLVASAVTLNLIAGAGITWLVWIAAQPTKPDPAYGEADSDGDFGNG